MDLQEQNGTDIESEADNSFCVPPFDDLERQQTQVITNRHRSSSAAKDNPYHSSRDNDLEHHEEQRSAISRRGSESISIPIESMTDIMLQQKSERSFGAAQSDDSNLSPTPKLMKNKVLLLKLCLLITLLCLTVVGAIAVYLYTSAEENDKFQYHYIDASSRVQKELQEKIDATLGGTAAMSVYMTSYASQANLTWPYVTIPNFYLLNNKYAKESEAVWTAVYHLVDADQRLGWEKYTSTHNDWIDRDIALQKTDPTYEGPFFDSRTDIDFIHGWDEYEKNETGINGTDRKGPYYMPNWQCAPVIPKYAIYNWDLLTSVNTSSIMPVLNQQLATVSAAYMIPDDNDKAKMQEAMDWADWFKDYIDPDENPMEPVSDISYPIHKEIQRSLEPGWDRMNYTVVAIMSSSFYWRDLLKAIVRETHSLDVVFHNECNPTFTYRIGSSVEFLGVGDRHSKQYDDLEVAFQLEYGTSSYSGVPVDKKVCPFNIRVYPTEAMHQDHMSYHPGFFSALTAMILLFALLVFAFYDWQVVSRQQSTNKNLKEANSKLKEASYLQLRHFAMMSHEIRTPLNGIVGMASLLESDENNNNLTHSQKESIDMILQSGELLRNVVNDILDYSKLVSGNHVVEIQRTNLQDVLSTVLFSFETSAKLKGITLKTQFDERVPAFFKTDGRRVQQILFNLISNAIKFSPEGETVFLGATLNYQSCTPRASALHPSLRLYVQDHGEGIEENNFDKIFEPFQQASVQTERLYGGTGLGLSITKKLVKALGASIVVESRVGFYAKFIVDFPLDEIMTPSGEYKFLDFDLCNPKIQERNYAVDFICSSQPTVRKVTKIFQYFNIKLYVHSSLSIKSFQSASDEKFKEMDYTAVFLIDEAKFDIEEYNRLLSLARGKTVTLTFGRNNSAGCNVSQKHFRSLEQMIPAAFMLDLDESVMKFSSIKHVPSKTTLTTKFEELRVLVAEDNLVNQKVIGRMLSRIGIGTVRIVDNGKKAVETEANEPFDVVLMDREMPIMDGVEACRKIQSREEPNRHPRARIIFLTAHVTCDMKEECMDAGAIAFLTKPCKVDEVRKCLRDLK